MTRKLVSAFLVLLLCFSLTICASAEEPILIMPAPGASASTGGLVFDDAGLLTDGETQALVQRLTAVGDAYGAQLIVFTIPSADGRNVDLLVEEIYDTMGFGFGPDRDGVLLLVCMDPREYRILSNGYAGTAIDVDTIASIGDSIVSDLSDGDYADAFQGFADECEYYLNGYFNGFPFEFGGTLILSLIIGLVVGLIVAFVLKAQLKSVRKQHQANMYVRQGSMHLTQATDLFLYRHVSRVKRETSKSSGGGRSGGSRSVGGGSF